MVRRILIRILYIAATVVVVAILQTSTASAASAIIQQKHDKKIFFRGNHHDNTQHHHHHHHHHSSSRNLQLYNNMNYQGSCNAGFCFVQALQTCYHQTSFECNAPPKPIQPDPTFQPTPQRRVDTIHPIAIILRNVVSSYVLGAEARSSMLRFVSERLTMLLQEVGLELSMVEYAGRLPLLSLLNNNNRQLLLLREGLNNSNNSNSNVRRRRTQESSISSLEDGSLQLLPQQTSTSSQSQSQSQQSQQYKTIAIPLSITVNGPADISDFSLSYLMEIIRSKILNDLLTYLKRTNSLNAGVSLSAETFNFDDIVTGDTSPPTAMPTPNPTVKVVTQAVVDEPIEESTSAAIAWWVWLIIVFVILMLLLCACIYCTRGKEGRQQKKQEEAINIWMQTGGTSVAPSHWGDAKTVAMRSQQQHQQQRSRQQKGGYAGGEEEMFLGQRMVVAARDRGSNKSSQQQYQKSRNNNNRAPNGSSSSSSSKKKKRRRHKPRQDERRRPGRDRHQAAIKRSICQTEMEVQIMREEEHDDFDDEHALVPYANSNNNGGGGAMVPYNDTRSYATEEPEGSKPTRQRSMYASEAYANMENYSVAENTRSTVEPEGKSAHEAFKEVISTPPQNDSDKSAYSVIGDSDHTNGNKNNRHISRDGSSRHFDKDELYACSPEELPEDVRSRRREKERGEDNEYYEKRERKKKSKKKSSRNKSSRNGQGNSPEKRRKKQSGAIETLRKSFSRLSSGHMEMDEVVDGPVIYCNDSDDSPSVLPSVMTGQQMDW